MVQLVELLSTTLMLAVYVGAFVGAVLLIMLKRDRLSLLLALGLIIAEVGRQFRIHGPAFSVETSDGLLRLTKESSLVVFLGKSLVIPIGLSLSMLSLLVITWQWYKSNSQKE